MSQSVPSRLELPHEDTVLGMTHRHPVERPDPTCPHDCKPSDRPGSVYITVTTLLQDRDIVQMYIQLSMVDPIRESMVSDTRMGVRLAARKYAAAAGFVMNDVTAGKYVHTVLYLS